MKRNLWSSLRTKIIAWSFVPTVIILSAVAWFTFYSYQEVIGDLAVKQELATLRTGVDEVALQLNNLINGVWHPIILDIDTNPELSPIVRAQNILDRAQNLEIFDGGIYFVDQQGRVFISEPQRPELIGQDWSDTRWFRYVRDNPPGSGPLTDIIAVGADGAEAVCAIWPMHNPQREFAGAGYYCLAIEPTGQNVLYESLNSLSLGQNVYVIDGQYRIIFSSDSGEVGRDLSEEAPIQELLQSESMSIRFRKGTEGWLIAYSPLSFTKDGRIAWNLVFEKRWSEIMEPSLPYRRLLLVLLALGVVVPVLASAYGVRHITQPIQKLIRAAEQVTAGQLKQRIEVKTGDEIETLADQFNLMSAELDESYSSLERKVADRTRELAVMNAIISVAGQSLDIREILEEALIKTVEQMGFEAGAAFRLEPASLSYILAAQRGFEPAAAADLAPGCPVIDQMSSADRRSEVTELQVNGVQDETMRRRLAQSGLQMLVCVPLSTKGRDLGLFLLGKRDLDPLSPEEISLLSAIGQQIGVAMENARLYEQAEQTAITAERTRLARELHDAVTQTLFSASLIADVLPRIWRRDPDEGLRNLEELRQLTRGALAEMRTLLLEMRPESLKRADINSLLTQLADAFVGRVRIPVDLKIDGECELALDVKIVFYRVAQEALNNIAKHAGARKVELRLECQPGRLNMWIIDDGLGFEPGSLPPDHMGVAIMRERANSIGADLVIESQVGQGTAVVLELRSGRRD